MLRLLLFNSTTVLDENTTGSIPILLRFYNIYLSSNIQTNAFLFDYISPQNHIFLHRLYNTDLSPNNADQCCGCFCSIRQQFPTKTLQRQYPFYFDSIIFIYRQILQNNAQSQCSYMKIYELTITVHEQ